MMVLLSTLLISLALFCFIQSKIRKQPLWLFLGLFLLSVSYYCLATPDFTTKSTFVWLGLFSLIGIIQIMLLGASNRKN